MVNVFASVYSSEGKILPYPLPILAKNLVHTVFHLLPSCCNHFFCSFLSYLNTLPLFDNLFKIIHLLI